jgi:hypothetical protein
MSDSKYYITVELYNKLTKYGGEKKKKKKKTPDFWALRHCIKEKRYMLYFKI